MLFTLFMGFALQTNAQVVSSDSLKAEISQANKVLPLEKVDKHGVPVVDQKFSVALALGNGYELKDSKYDTLPGCGNSITSSVRLGYALSKYVEIQVERSATSDFVYRYGGGGYVWTDDISAYLKYKFKLSATALNLNLKLGLPIVVKGVTVKPYVVKSLIGTGRIKASSELGELDSYGQPFYSSHFSYNPTAQVSKIGGGIEVTVYDHISLFWEQSWWKMEACLKLEKIVIAHSETLFGVSVGF